MNDLLETLSESRLPAHHEGGEPAEPQEAVERYDISERGRSPDEVVQTREARLPAEERHYEVGGRRYTADELERSGMLKELATAHAQHKHLQEKYNALLEQSARSAEAPAPPAQITNSHIAAVYDPVAETITRDLVERDLIESDLPEAYPRAIQTLIGQMRFAFDKLFQIEAAVFPMIAEVQAAKKQVQAQAVVGNFNAQLDALAAKGSQFAGLKSRKTRDLFTEFLVSEVGATVGQACGENAQSFLARQWVGFNSDDVIRATKASVEARRQRNLRRFAAGENTGSRMGVTETSAETPLERMIRQSGKISE